MAKSGYKESHIELFVEPPELVHFYLQGSFEHYFAFLTLNQMAV
jgi:hypothetical protein